MKIIQINTVCGHGSTGSIAVDIATEVRKKEDECYIAYGQGSSNYSDSHKIGGWLENKWHGLFYSRLLGLQGYGTRRGTRQLIQWIDQIQPDIIHLHNLHGNYLNHPLLFNYIITRQLPVVITLHDCYNFTGKCSHYTATGCYKWQSECKQCPLLRKTIAPSYFLDRSRKIFLDKKRWYSQIKKMAVVAVSRWLEHEARASILTQNGHTICHIYNWVDYRKFHRASQKEIQTIYHKYGLDSQFKYLISVGAGWDKKTSKYKDALKLSELLPNGYKLLLVGGTSKGTAIESPIYHIPYVSDAHELSIIYSMATAYIHLSVEDTFGKVIAEAMACGTPPIVFNSTACPEVADKYGYIIPPHDVVAIIALLPQLNISESQRCQMVDYVRENFNYSKNIEQYIKLYESILQ